MKGATPKRILIADDEPQVLHFLTELFELDGWDVHVASTGTEAIEQLERDRFDVILTDLKMPGADGIGVLRTAKEIQPDAEVVLMTAYATVENAIEVMRAGAFHYIIKPFRAEEVRHLVSKAYDQRRLRRENRYLKAESRGEYRLQGVVGTSPAVQQTVSAVRRLADTGMPVLLSGERGTGRNFLARTIHFHSSRSDGLFVPVHCGGLPEDVLKADLFGYAAGAFQHAVLPHPGKIELADHGTIYLADVGEAGPRVQERLLRFLANRTVAPVGSDEAIELDVRVLASTSADLDALVAAGKFLGALRDHFTAGTIVVHPLRERIEDIPLLLHHFLFEGNRDRKKPLKGISEAALSALKAYPWPGNVRELRDLMRTISTRKKQGTVVDAADLPPEILYKRRRKAVEDEAQAVPVPTDIRATITGLEKPMVMQALALVDHDKEVASELLHIEVATLEELMRRYGIE